MDCGLLISLEKVSKLALAFASLPFVRRNLGDSGAKNIGAVPRKVTALMEKKMCLQFLTL
jgi:hypothetical protein